MKELSYPVGFRSRHITDAQTTLSGLLTVCHGQLTTPAPDRQPYFTLYHREEKEREREREKNTKETEEQEKNKLTISQVDKSSA